MCGKSMSIETQKNNYTGDRIQKTGEYPKKIAAVLTPLSLLQIPA
jgi:hypothetical protein